MDISLPLQIAAQKSEIRVDDQKNLKRSPPFYYDSLRHGLGAYFNTFRSSNAVYDHYARGTLKKGAFNNARDFLDEDNTVLTIISFERFFELFLKHLLEQTSPKLVAMVQGRLKGNFAEDLIKRIRNGNYDPKRHNGKTMKAPFRDIIERFYGLIKLANQNYPDALIRKFSRILKRYTFLDSRDHEASFRLLSWYRDRILHNGSSLPSMWFLDYMVTQKIVPIVVDITKADHDLLGQSTFYFETATGINILEKLCEIKFELKHMKSKRKGWKEEMFVNYLYIGQLKELGRANLNMNLYMRNNIQATYEYNYLDPKGRGRRFAKAEKVEHPDAKDLKSCPCCGEISLVVYGVENPDILSGMGISKYIAWVKCYTCDYHLRHNAGEPVLFGIGTEEILNPFGFK